MKHTLFIADLHLDPHHPDTTQRFLEFIQQQAIHAAALYILGDFFELWIGDDDTSPFNEQIIQALKQLSARKIPLYFLHGNRDFLIGKKFAKQTGMTLLPQFAAIKLYDHPVLLLHGDALCTLDTKHMRFRRLFLNPIIKKLFLMLPLFYRRKLGERARKMSRQHHTDLSKELFDVVHASVVETMRKYHVNHMIHGHVHKADVSQFWIDNQPAERIVLGAWENKEVYKY